MSARWRAREGLDARAIEFRGSRPRHVVLPGFLDASLAQRVGGFLEQRARYRSSFGLRDRCDEVSREDYLSAADEDRFYHYQLLEDDFARKEDAVSAIELLRVCSVLRSAGFAALAARVTGLSLRSPPTLTVHRMQVDHHLRPHDDEREDRVLAYLLYLAPGFSGENGGDLVFTEAGEIVARVPPSFNSLLLFDVAPQYQHYVAPILGGPQTARIGLGGWFAPA